MGRHADLAGGSFNNWKVISFDEVKTNLHKGRDRYWKCRCTCGYETSLTTTKLTKGYSKKCPTCSALDRRIDITGYKYGNLEAVKFEKMFNKKSYWIFKCACGNLVSLQMNRVQQGLTKSCGCMHWQEKDKHPNWKGYGEIGMSIFSKLKREAEIRSLEFNITIEYLWDLFLHQNRKCALSGVDIHFGDGNSQRNRTCSLDRIDPSTGYIESNIQWVHKHINMMKQSYSQDYFIKLCKAVAITCKDCE
jgi:hypothetical protein